ncbi:MAG TPA: urate hydroxylase PuuD [Mycobacteriales bacterium]|nr:urate hydroxylase PuuD [Mycobacteriales bacterium]
MEIFTQTGGEILARWGHYLSGVTWIGLLYYFNFVQVPAFAEFEAGPRTEAIRKLAPRALWWFRWAAVATVATGILIMSFSELYRVDDFWQSPPGYSITTGVLLALVMFLNVWGIIWRNQKIVIASAEGVAAGREADPAAAAAGRKAFLASRTNTVMSIPMLFFMAATSHFAGLFDAVEGGKRATYLLVVLLIVAALELNALGVIGGTAPGPTKKYLDTHKNAIIAGFALTAVFLVLFELTFRV